MTSVRSVPCGASARKRVPPDVRTVPRASCSFATAIAMSSPRAMCGGLLPPPLPETSAALEPCPRSSGLRFEQLEDSVKRYTDPIGSVVQLVVELVERLVEHEQFQQRIALGDGGWDEERSVRRPEISAQKRRGGPTLPDACPRLEAFEVCRS